MSREQFEQSYSEDNGGLPVTMIAAQRQGDSYSVPKVARAWYWWKRAVGAEPYFQVLGGRDSLMRRLREIVEASGVPVGDCNITTPGPDIMALGQDVIATFRPSQKYDDTLLPFLALMRNELHANSHKGDREGWLRMTLEQALDEIRHHADKLIVPVMNHDREAIREHAADVANCAMMLADIAGVLSRE